MFALILASHNYTILAAVLSVLGIAAAVYEHKALKSHRLPTITKIVKGLPVPAKWGAILLTVLVVVDHFGTELVL